MRPFLSPRARRVPPPPPLPPVFPSSLHLSRAPAFVLPLPAAASSPRPTYLLGSCTATLSCHCVGDATSEASNLILQLRGEGKRKRAESERERVCVCALRRKKKKEKKREKRARLASDTPVVSGYRRGPVVVHQTTRRRPRPVPPRRRRRRPSSSSLPRAVACVPRPRSLETRPTDARLPILFKLPWKLG